MMFRLSPRFCSEKKFIYYIISQVVYVDISPNVDAIVGTLIYTFLEQGMYQNY